MRNLSSPKGKLISGKPPSALIRNYLAGGGGCHAALISHAVQVCTGRISKLTLFKPQPLLLLYRAGLYNKVSISVML